MCQLTNDGDKLKTVSLAQNNTVSGFCQLGARTEHCHYTSDFGYKQLSSNSTRNQGLEDC